MRALMSAQVDPRPLAVARVGVGLATLVTVIEGVFFLSKVEAGRIAMPVFGWAPSPTLGSLLALMGVGVAGALALTVGFQARAAAAVSVAVEIVIFLWDQQTYSNHRFLIALLLTYLVLARSDAGWSMTRRPPTGTTVAYWPQFLMMTQLSVCYLFAALNKVSIVFLSGAVLRGAVWMPLPPAVATVLSIAAVLVEFFLAVGLWLPRLRLWAAVLGVGLHLSIVAMMTEHAVLAAFAAACVPLYPLFLRRPSGVRNEPAPERRPAAVATAGV